MAFGNPARIVKWLLAVIVVAVVAAVGGMFYLTRTVDDAPGKLLSAVSENTDIALDNISHTAASEGRTQWRLTAEKARVTDGKQQIQLTRPAVIFYLEDGGEVRLTADRGVLETRSNDIAVSGNVVVTNRDYRLTTEALQYTHDSRVLAADRPVAIEARWAALTAQHMRVDLDAGTADFDGNVKGWLTRDLS